MSSSRAHDANQFRRLTYGLLSHQDHENSVHHAFHLMLIILILSNITVEMLEVMSTLDQVILRYLHTFDLVSVGIFSLEWLLRIWSCVEDPLYSHPVNGRLRFIGTPVMIIDLLAVLSFYLPMAFMMDLRFLRVFRLFHIVRVYVDRSDLLTDS